MKYAANLLSMHNASNKQSYKMRTVVLIVYIMATHCYKFTTNTCKDAQEFNEHTNIAKITRISNVTERM